jgi:hypothetical protein
MRLRIHIMVDDDEEPRETVDLPVPEPPSDDYPGGGHWRWTGKLPRTRVDVSENYCLAIYVIRADSTHARTLEHSAAVARRGANRVPPKPEPTVLPEPAADPSGAPAAELVVAVAPDPPAPAQKHACDLCHREFDTSQGLALHRTRSGHGKATAPAEPEEDDEDGAEEPPPMVQSPEPKTVPVAKARLTDKICASAVEATFDGKTIAAWAEANRFVGNMNALTPWVNMVVRATSKAAWRAMSEVEKERFVLRAIGGKIKEDALSGGDG